MSWYDLKRGIITFMYNGHGKGMFSATHRVCVSYVSDIRISGILLDFISSNITWYKTNAICSCQLHGFRELYTI